MFNTPGYIFSTRIFECWEISNPRISYRNTPYTIVNKIAPVSKGPIIECHIGDHPIQWCGLIKSIYIESYLTGGIRIFSFHILRSASGQLSARKIDVSKFTDLCRLLNNEFKNR
jgi:hypothetical protein